MSRNLYRLGIVAITAISLASCGGKKDTTQPQVRKLTAAAYASGTLLPEQEYKVVSTVDGYLQEAYVNEGDTVTKGQALFLVTNEVRDVQTDGAAAVVQKTLPTVGSNAPLLQELSGRIEVARIKKQQDSLDYIRNKNLFDNKAISKSTYERVYLQYQSSAKDYQNLKRQYEQQTLTSNLQLQQAENQLQINRAQQNVGKLKSFVDGVVYDVYKKQGDLISPTQPVALIGAGDMIAKLLVDEDDLDKVYEGQEVLITMDAFEGKVFKAHINKVYPLLNKVEQSFRVDAVLDDKLPAPIYGLNLEANIVLAKDKEVLVIPRSALHKGDSVLVKGSDGQKMVHITTGISDDDWIEVKDGLDKNATIIMK